MVLEFGSDIRAPAILRLLYPAISRARNPVRTVFEDATRRRFLGNDQWNGLVSAGFTLGAGDPIFTTRTMRALHARSVHTVFCKGAFRFVVLHVVGRHLLRLPLQESRARKRWGRFENAGRNV